MSVTVAKTAGFCFGVDRAVEMVKKGRPNTAMAYVDAALGELLDQEDFIEEAYILEVSSPGLGRPLKKEKV